MIIAVAVLAGCLLWACAHILRLTWRNRLLSRARAAESKSYADNLDRLLRKYEEWTELSKQADARKREEPSSSEASGTQGAETD